MLVVAAVAAFLTAASSADASAFAAPLPPPSVVLQSKASISFSRGAFTLKANGKTLRVPAVDDSRKATQKASTDVNGILFRKDDAFVRWDARGLTIRKGNRATSTWLPAVSLTPKLFSTEEIVATRACFAMGLRSPFASSIAGAKRIGADVFLLVRWVDAFDLPWLEALIKVDLNLSVPKAQLVGAFQGYAFGSGQDLLKGLGANVAAMVSRPGDVWGRAQYDTGQNQFQFEEMGQGLDSLAYTSSQTGWAIETTSYGTNLFSRFHLPTTAKRTLMESRGPIRLLDGDEPWLALAKEERGLWLHNLDSAAKLLVPNGSGLKRTPLGLLVWTASAKPTSAWLYELDRFDLLASWPAR